MNLADVRSWIFPISGVTFLIVYPVAVLLWTIVENVAQRGDRRRERRGSRCKVLFGKGDECSEVGKGCLPVLAAPRLWKKATEVKSKGSALLAGAARMLYPAAVIMWLALRLVVYALLLAPWFLKIGYMYARNKRIHRGVRCGPNPRNYVDIYLPSDLEGVQRDGAKKVPVIVAVMGGAWVIGHRLWSCQLGMRLAQAGVIVVAVDYRNFPQAHVHEMVEDLGGALDWVFANIADYGGDVGNVSLIGQSAGAHLSAMLLLERGLAEAADTTDATPKGWAVGDLRCFVGVSGVYDLVELEQHLERRGIYPFINHICADGDVAACSPVCLLEEGRWQAAAARMPPVSLYHGGADHSVPPTSTTRFAEALRTAGLRHVQVEVRPGIRHAEPVVEDPLRGLDTQVELVLPFVFGAEQSQRLLRALPPLRPTAPRLIVNTAIRIMPF